MFAIGCCVILDVPQMGLDGVLLTPNTEFSNRAPGERDILWHFMLPPILLPASHRVGGVYNSVTLYWLASLDGVQTLAKP